MEKSYSNTECKLHGTKYCRLLNMESCESCTINAVSAEQAEKLCRDLEVTISLMPEEGLESLFDTDECMLCKGENKGKREYYADTDIGNVQPKTEGRNIVGMKTISRTGSMVPLQIACCKECRKRLLMIEYAPTLMTVGVCALALIIMSLRPVREALMGMHMILPLVIFVVVAALALIFGRMWRKRLVDEGEKACYLRVFDLPLFAGMRERGWFEINEGKGGVTRYIFAKKRIRQGLYTGESAGMAEKPQE